MLEPLFVDTSYVLALALGATGEGFDSPVFRRPTAGWTVHGRQHWRPKATASGTRRCLGHPACYLSSRIFRRENALEMSSSARLTSTSCGSPENIRPPLAYVNVEIVISN